jgi:hypothetical protein
MLQLVTISDKAPFFRDDGCGDAAMGVIYEKSIWAFLFVTVIAGGGAAYMVGRAAAKGWNPFWQAAVQVLGLASAVRFLHWGLFAGATFESWREAQGSLFSLHYYLVDAAFLLIFAALGFKRQRTVQMSRQYSWLTVQTSPLSWRLREPATMPPQSHGTATSPRNTSQQ